jgi:hypothetical protein
MHIYYLLSTLLVGCHCFSPHPSCFRRRINVLASTLPTITELSSDPFTKQISHSEAVISLLIENETSDELPPLLKAQLSHSDGIRGFFATYLTHERSPNNVVPAALRQAMELSENHEHLID